MPAWSLANIGGMRLADHCRAQGLSYDPARMLTIFESTRDAAYRIIERKGSYLLRGGRRTDAHHAGHSAPLEHGAIGLELDRQPLRNDVCFSLPTVVDRGGIQKVLRLELNETEVASLRQFAAMLKQTIAALGEL